LLLPTAIAHLAPPGGHQACWAKITPKMPPPLLHRAGVGHKDGR
jgi:hypothetical protein